MLVGSSIPARTYWACSCQHNYAQWRTQDLSALEPVYVWAGGSDVKAGLESTKAALLVLIAALADGTNVVHAVESGRRESSESWAEIVRDRTRSCAILRRAACPRRRA